MSEGKVIKLQSEQDNWIMSPIRMHVVRHRFSFSESTKAAYVNVCIKKIQFYPDTFKA